MKMDFPKKTVSRENDENLGGSELSDDNKNEEMGQRRPGTLNLNLNNPPDERHSKLGFQSGANFPEEQTENEEKDYAVHCVEAYFKGMETLSDEESEEGSGSSSKRKRYLTEEKGEAKIENESSPTEIIFDIEDDLALLNLTTLSLVATNEESDSNLEKEGTQMNEFQRAREWRERRLREAKRRHYEVARYCARRLAHPQEYDSFNKGNKKGVLKEAEDESQDFGGGPFYEAVVTIKKRNLAQELKWMPAKNKAEVRKCGVPSLLDLSLKILARNAEAIVSLELVPDFLRHKLSQIVRKKRKMNARFLELLASGSPTEIRLNDCSEINTDDFTRIFGACDKKNLIVSDFYSLLQRVLHYFSFYFSLKNQGQCWPSFLKLYDR